MMVATVRKRLTVSKQAARKFDVERFILGKLSVLEFRKQYQIQTANRFAGLENSKVSQDINSA